jgi:hypothetical protein
MEIIFADTAEFACVPKDLRVILRQGMSLAHGNMPQERGAVACRLLHADIEDALLSAEEETSQLAAARQCLAKVKQVFPQRVIKIEAAATALLQRWARDSTHQGLDAVSPIVASVVRLTRWALQAGKPRLISHLLVDCDRMAGRLRLVPSFKAFVGSCYDRYAQIAQV